MQCALASPIPLHSVNVTVCSKQSHSSFYDIFAKIHLPTVFLLKKIALEACWGGLFNASLKLCMTPMVKKKKADGKLSFCNSYTCYEFISLPQGKVH